jgi:hypothetical protein
VADPTATPATKFRVRIDNELFVVTDNRTTTWTVAGAQGGSSAANHSSGATVTEVLTANSFVELQATPATGIFGDGSDGTVSISGTTTLTRDMKYDTLTITGTGRLKTAGWRVLVKNTLTVQASGRVDADGDPVANSSTGAGFTALNSTALGRGGGGGNGGTTNGTAGQITNGQNGQLAGAGGGGGNGASGSGAAGGSLAAGTLSTLTAPRQVPEALMGFAPNGANASGYGGYEGGTGGGGGGGDGTVAGGGGGGVAIVSCLSFTGTTPTANGGAGGTKTGTGTNGTAGAAGSAFLNVWAP